MLITKDQAEATIGALADLGEAVRQRRGALDIGQRTAAAKIGISQQTIMRIEHGHIPGGGPLRSVLQWLADTAWLEQPGVETVLVPVLR